ncbi:hypothetical protein D3C76_1062270 [compost metagenome]
MGQVEVLLLVDVGQFRVPDADLGAFFVEGVFTAAEVETVGGERAAAVHRHVFHARVVARAVGAELAAVEGQAADFGGGHLATAEGLRQGAAVVGAQDRQYRHPFTDLQFGLRHLALEGHAQATEVIGRTTVIVHRQQLRTGRATAAVELDRVHAQHVNAETDGALGEAGLGVEDETLGPFLGFALGGVVVDEVAIEVGVAQVQRGLGIIDEAFGVGGGGQKRGKAAAAEQ